MMPRTTIVVPCYNEADRLDVGRHLQAVGGDGGLSLLFVNDGSTDRTLEVLEGLRRRGEGRIGIVSLSENAGKAEAVRQGMLAALGGSPDYVGYWDADLATPLEVVASFRVLLEERPRLAMVAGARVRLLGRSIQRRGSRHYLGRIFASTASLVLRLGVYDTQCGAKLFRATPVVAGLFERPFLSRWVFDVEIIARLIEAHRSAGLPEASEAIYEYPLERWCDVGGSKLKGRDFARAAIDLARIHNAHRIRPRSVSPRHRPTAAHRRPSGPHNAPTSGPHAASSTSERVE